MPRPRPAWARDGHSADGSLPATTICPSGVGLGIAAWIDGSLRLAQCLRCHWSDDDLAAEAVGQGLLAAVVGDDLVGVLGVLRDEVHQQGLLGGRAGC